MFLFCVLSDLMYLCDCIGIRRTVKTGCYVIADSSTYFADAVAYGNIFQPYSYNLFLIDTVCFSE